MCVAIRVVVAEETLELHDRFQVVEWLELGAFAGWKRLAVLRDRHPPQITRRE